MRFLLYSRSDFLDPGRFAYNKEERDKEMKRERILTVVILVTGLLLALGLYRERKQEQEKAIQTARQMEEVKPYENEIMEITEQMKEEKVRFSYLSDTARMLVGYRLYTPDDLVMIQRQAEEYGFSPVIVLDCSMESMELANLIASVADRGWEIMLTVSPVTETITETVSNVRETLGQYGLSDTGVFLLKSGDYSEETVEKLKDNGFQGYTCFSDAVINGCDENGMVYFEYWYVQKGDASMETKLEQLTTDRKSMITVFDLQSMNMGLLSEKSITERLDLMKNYAGQEKMVYASVAEIVEELSDINAVQEQHQKEYEAYVEKQQEKIDELEGKIHKILYEDKE